VERSMQTAKFPTRAIWIFFAGVSLLGLGAALWLISLAAEPFELAFRGVVVESQKAGKADPGGAATKAGLRVGDRILSWSRGATHGTIESPFDLEAVDKNERPHGMVVLAGLRGRTKKSWAMGPDQWWLETRPILPRYLLTGYLEAVKVRAAATLMEPKTDPERRRRSEQRADAANRVLKLADDPGKTQPVWARPWLLVRAAEWWTEADRWDLAETAYAKAIALGEPGSPVLKTLLVNDHASMLADSGLPQSREALIYSASASESMGWRIPRAESLALLCNLSRYEANFEEANDYCHQAADSLSADFRNTPDYSAVLNSLGLIAFEQGDPSLAEIYYNEALSIEDKSNPGTGASAGILLNLGVVANIRGDLVKAEGLYNRAYRIFEREGNDGKGGMAAAATGLGLVYEQRRDFSKAEDWFQKAVQWATNRRSDLVAGNLENLGDTSVERGEWNRAVEYYRKALNMQNATGNRKDAAGTLNALGRVAMKNSNWSEAEKAYLQAQSQSPKGSLDYANSLSNLADVYSAGGEFSQAANYYRQAAALQIRIAPGSMHAAESLYALAHISARAGKLLEAVPDFEKAIAILEAQTVSLGGTEETKFRYRAEYRKFYSDYVDALADAKQNTRAFEVSERSRARSFLKTLAERDLAFSNDVPAEILRARKLNAASYDRALAEIAGLDPAKDAAQIEQLKSRMRDLMEERERIAERAKSSSPRFAALAYPSPLSLREILDRKTLDPGTVLLSYSIGEARSWLFVLPADAKEPAVYQIPAGADALHDRVAQFQQLIDERERADHAALVSRGKDLYKLLLQPAQEQIGSAQRLLIVADGALHTLPFAALVQPDGRYLIQSKPVHTILSVTVYAQVKKGRAKRANPQFELAAFGDPHYPDLRVQEADPSSVPESRTKERGLVLRRLPFSAVEVDEIAEAVPGKKAIFLGAKATEEAAKLVAGSTRYLHFAVHGFLDEDLPLNSSLALSIPDKNQRQQRDNGLLQAWEVIEQMRMNADLVVLSACQTALGKNVSGEGLIGLTRAFQYAGARSVVATLWRVDDLAAANLMSSFYRFLKNPTHGSSKDTALQLAQQQLIAEPTIRSGQDLSLPYYWAAYTLTGDWQ
jgi:CHAT domain-containing protein/Tfp pilus assembly protein PilF